MNPLLKYLFWPLYLMIWLSTWIIPNVQAQNIIYNGGFEEYSELPNANRDYLKCLGWYVLDLNYYSSPDYYIEDSASGSQLSLHIKWCTIKTFRGQATRGLLTYSSLEYDVDISEYLSTKFIQPMEIGGIYKLSFWFTNGDSVVSEYGYSHDGIGIFLSSTPPYQSDFKVLNVEPQLQVQSPLYSNKWQKVSFEFVADSAYEFFTIGNFLPDSELQLTNELGIENNGAYYFIDEISVIRTDKYIDGRMVICPGEVVNMEAYNLNSYNWVDVKYPKEIISQDSSFSISLEENTTFLVFDQRDTIVHSIEVIQPEISFFGSDTSVCKSEELVYYSPDVQLPFIWSNGTDDDELYITEGGKYWIEFDYGNCISSDTILVYSKLCDCDAYIPNSFSPNGDLINDVFQPKFDCPLIYYHLSIYNVWGDRIFESYSEDIGWIGDPVKSESQGNTYLYSLDYKLGDGKLRSEKGQIYMLK